MSRILDKVVDLGNGFIEKQKDIAAGKVLEDINARVLYFTWDAH